MRSAVHKTFCTHQYLLAMSPSATSLTAMMWKFRDKITGGSARNRFSYTSHLRGVHISQTLQEHILQLSLGILWIGNLTQPHSLGSS